jgi:uncharacterized membrane protein YgcG
VPHHLRPAARGAAAIAAAALALAPAVLLASPAAAEGDVDDFSFASVEVEYDLTRDAEGHARLAVTETWVAEFPEIDQNRGMVREIPRYDGRVDLRTSVTGVTDETGAPVFWEEDGDELLIDDDEFKHGLHTYVISYSMRDVVRDFDDGDEFFPNVTGTDWAQPIGAASATLRVDADLAAELDGRTACFAGPSGSTDSACRVVTEADADGAAVVEVAADSGLAPGEGLSFVVGFAPGTFATPPQSALTTTAIVLAVVAPALALLHLLWVLVQRARHRRSIPRPIIAQYTPPRGVPLAVSATVLGRSAKLMPAAVLDLALRDLVEVRTSGEGRSSAKDFTLAPAGSAPGDGPDGGDGLAAALFGTKRKPFRLDATSNSRAKRLESWRKRQDARAREGGWIRGHGALGLQILAYLLSFVILMLAIAVLVMGGVGAIPLAVSLPAALGAIAIQILSVVLVPRVAGLTGTGGELAAYLEGLREYLRVAEEDRIRHLQSPSTAETRRVGSIEAEPADAAAADDVSARLHLYERLLPYAVLLGVERQWAGVHEELGRAAAAAGAGVSAGHLAAYGIAQHRIMSASSGGLSTTTATSSSGASSGFSSGGGFSGGGFGGGGGGGR